MGVLVFLYEALFWRPILSTIEHSKNLFRQIFLSFTLLCSLAALHVSAQPNPEQNAVKTSGSTGINSAQPQRMGSFVVNDVNGNNVIDSGDLGLMLLNVDGTSADSSADESSDASDSPRSSFVGTGMQGLYGRNYLLAEDGSPADATHPAFYSVIDVYMKFGSALGTGSNGERVVNYFGQATTDASTYSVTKISKYDNSANLAYQHSNTSWLPAAGAAGGTGNNTWDSFLTVGARTQGAGNTGGVTPDVFFMNPNTNVGVIQGGSSTTGFVGAGVYQAAPTDAEFETNASAHPDRMVMFGRFTLKCSDIAAAPGGISKLTFWCDFVGKSSAQTGGTTLYTMASANVKSDAQTKYTTSSKVWTFDPTFEGVVVGQDDWSFASSLNQEPSVIDLMASVGLYSDRVQLNFTPLVSATGYSIWRAEGAGAYAQVGTIPGNTGAFADTTAVVGTTYNYKVQSAGGIRFSNIVSGLRSSIAAPVNVVASDGTFTNKVEISWDPVAGVDGYQVFRSGTAAQINPTDSGAVTTYSDTGVAPGAGYTYTVKSVLGAQVSGAQTGNLGYRALATPIPPSASMGDYIDAILVSWSPVTGATGYLVYRDGGPDEIATTTGTSFNDTGASTTIKHTYRVKATTTVATSPASGVSNTAWVGMMWPDKVYATAGTYADKVIVSWTEVPGALGYQINRGGTVGAGGGVGSVPASKLSFDDTTVGVAQGYTYNVAAINSFGLGPFKASAVSAGYRNVSPPTNVAASTTLPDKIQITWTASSSTTGYDIYRNDKATQIASIAGGATVSFDDLTALPATNYSYFVRATNLGARCISDPSATVNGLRGSTLPTPLITTVNPNTGPLAGATAVTITGANFTGASSVTVGGVPATSVVVISPTQINLLTPSASAGAKTIVVTTPSGSASKPNAFTYTNESLPTIALVTPSAGPIAGGTPMTITGSRLLGASVKIGAVAMTNLTVTDTQITGLSGANTVGVKDVVVTTTAGAASGLSLFSYVAEPTLISVSPTSGPLTGGTTVTLVGTNLSGAIVTINSSVATLLSNSATQITFLTPSSTAGIVDLLVITAGGTAATSFTYLNVPTISSVSPNTGPDSGGTSIVITGSNFNGITGVTIGANAATNIVVASSTSILAQTPAGTAGAKNVVVTTATSSGTKENAFTYTDNSTLPSISAIAPNSGTSLGGTAVTISGANLLGATGVSIGGVACPTFVVASATSIVAISPPGVEGAALDVVVNTPSGPVTQANAFTYVDFSVPTISGISPTIGLTSGGTAITISGTNLSGSSAVTVGGVAASEVVFVSASVITAVTPEGTAGSKDVVVSTPTGPVTKVGGFTYKEPTPTITSVTPVSGSVAGGTAITINGTNLAGASSVSVGGNAVTGLVATATKITAVTSAGTAGTQSVVVVTPGGSFTKANAFTYDTSLPTIAVISPVSAPLAGGVAFKITGTNLAGAISVTIDGIEATSLVASATEINAVAQAGTAGAKDIVVTTTSGTSVTAPNSFTYFSAPTVTTVTPNIGPESGGTAITIAGSNFIGATSVTIGGVPAINMVVVSAVKITALTPPGSTGRVAVAVVTPGGTGQLASGFQYNSFLPTITGVSPSTGPTSGGTQITVTGTNLMGATLTINNVDAPIVDNSSDTSITAITPAGAAGAKTIVATTNSGMSTQAITFTYFSATVKTVTPNLGPTSGGTGITITGSDLTGATRVTIGGNDVTSFVQVSSAKIVAVTPAGTSGESDIMVTVPSGDVTKTAAFRYTNSQPTISTVTPSASKISVATPITITGTNFGSALAGVSVSVGGVAATSPLFVSTTKITATTPASTVAGDKDIVVTTSNGIVTQFAGFTYYGVPTIASVSPAAGPIAAGTIITITGTNLSDATIVTVGGVAATNISVISSTSIVAFAPAGVAGAQSVGVTTPGGVGTKASAYTFVAAPTIASVTPSTGPTSGGTSFTITGTNLSGASVTIGGIAASSVVATATSITAKSPSSTSKIAKPIVVTTSGGTSTPAPMFTYTGVAPIIASLDPASGPVNGGTLLTINGSNFTGATSVTIGGAVASNMFVSSSLIRVNTPSGVVGDQLVVVNSPEGPSTQAMTFTYTAVQAPTITFVSPSFGPTAGGTPITIGGTNLIGASVTIGGAAALNVVVTATQITAVTPPSTDGVKTIAVTTAGGTATTSFNYGTPEPTITSVNPDAGPTSGGTLFTITGTNLTGASSVKVGGVAATSVVVVDATHVTAVTPAGTAGVKSVSLTTVGGTFTAGGAFTYIAPAPTISSVSPSSGSTLGGTLITITGTNLTGATIVTIGSVGVTSFTVVSATSISAVTPEGAVGPQIVAVTTEGGSASKPNAFTYVTPLPTITLVNPNSGVLAGGTAITITGTNFTGATVVKIGANAATSMVVVSDTSITAVTPAGSAGAQSVAVTTAGGIATAPAAFTYTNVSLPSIASVSPTSGPSSGGTAITITGTNLTGATSVKVGGVAATSVVVASATSITAVTPAGTLGQQDVLVTTPLGSATAVNAFTYEIPAPTIASLSPTSGTTLGGTTVTISGANLTGATSVTFGGVAATNVVVVSDTSITAVTPARTAGAKSVVVTTPAGIATALNAFTFELPAPTITSVNPNTGVLAGGTDITISGTNLSAASSVTIDGVAVTSIVINGAGTQIAAVTPAGTAGAKNLAVTTAGGTATKVGAFTYTNATLPTIASVIPNSGVLSGGTAITITGTNLTGATSVKIGGVAATSMVVVSATSITAVTPAGAVGAKDVVVITPSGNATGTNAFTYLDAPTIVSVSPNTGSTNSGTAITITGTNLTGASSVTVGGVAATNLVVVSATSITAKTPTGTAGVKPVVVTTPGGIATLAGGFTYVQAPTIASVTPSTGVLAGGTAITITGTNLTGAISVTVGGTQATSVVVVNATTITALTPAATEGVKPIVVSTLGGATTQTVLFNYINVPAPTITSVSPISGSISGGTAITITGINLTGATSVTVGGAAATSVVVVSATSITAVTPAGAAGAQSVAVTTEGGTATKANAFTYVVLAPTIASVSPTSGAISGGTAITITGTNLTGASSVTVGGVAATSFVVVSATSVTAVTPSGTAGAKAVAVTTAGGTATKANAFTYVVPVPTIASVSPTSGVTSGGTAITIEGTHFIVGATTVKVGGVAATGVVVASDTSLTAVTPAGTLGLKAVAVTTSGGTATAVGAFTYLAAAPTIASVSPTFGSALGATKITIVGTNLTGASSVTVGGKSATSVVVVNATTITAMTPSGTVGAQDVAVTTSGGTATAPSAFTYVAAAPTIASISPTSGPALGATAITITGTNLTGATSVTVGGVAANNVVVVSATSITAKTPAGTAGAKDVSVTTAGGTATLAGAFTYGITAPTGVVASQGTSTAHVAMTWNAVAGATSFDVFRDGGATKIGSTIGSLTNYNDTTAVPGTLYAYAVKANSGSAQSALSASASGFRKLSAPTNVVCAGGLTDRIRISWNASIGATSYQILRNGSSNPIGTSTTTSYDDMTATIGVNFSYTVKAVCALGVSDLSSPVIGWRAPVAPLGVSASDGTSTTQVTISWSAVAGVSGYDVLRDGNKIGSSIGIQTIYQDASALPGIRYTYTVKSVTVAGSSAASLGDVGYRGALEIPTEVAASDGTFTDKISITWIAAYQATGYEILRAGVKIATVGASPLVYNDTTAAIGTVYPYAVRATRPTGPSALSVANSGWRNVVAPLSVVASAGTFTDKIKVTWKATPGATGYAVYRSGTAGVLRTIVGNASTTFYDTSALVATVYTYTVKATVAAGASVASVESSGYRLLATPQNFVAGDGTSTEGVELTWNSVDGAQRYRVLRRIGTASPIFFDVPEGNTFVDSSAVLGTIYNYSVEAVSTVCSSVASAVNSGYTGVPIPAGFVASEGLFTDKVALSWTSSIGATGYEVFRNGVATPLATLVGNASTTFSDMSAVTSTVYSYTVKAMAGTVRSAASAQKTGFKAPVVVAPTNVQSSDGTSTMKVNISWNPASGATSYEVLRDASTLPLGTSFTTSYEDTSAQIGVVYKYQVKAVNAASKSPLSVANTGYRNAEAPKNLVASNGTFSTKVALSWSAVTGATGYEISRSGLATSIGVNAGASSTSFDDITGVLNTVYTYTVKAKIPAGLSAASAAVAGSRALSKVIGVIASDGTSAQWIEVKWTKLPGATKYKLMRSDKPTTVIATTIGNTAVTYKDTSAVAGIVYGYTVAAETSQGLTNPSESDSGYRRASFTGDDGNTPSDGSTTDTGLNGDAGDNSNVNQSVASGNEDSATNAGLDTSSTDMNAGDSSADAADEVDTRSLAQIKCDHLFDAVAERMMSNPSLVDSVALRLDLDEDRNGVKDVCQRNQGDVDLNGVVDESDLVALMSAFAAKNMIADLNLDGQLDSEDIAMYLIALEEQESKVNSSGAVGNGETAKN